MIRILFFNFMFIGFLALFTSAVSAQGCSDAGFCTINSFKPNSNDSVSSVFNQVKVGAFIGNADHSITATGGYVEYNRYINEKLALDVKITTIAQSGNTISVFGASDIFINGAYKVKENFKFVLGAKIPLSKADKSLNELPLPMDYQSSLGTFDIILGFGYEIKGFQLVAAIQQPLTQNNNLFLSSLYPEDSELRKFQSTQFFKRSADVLLRVSYPFALSEKFNATLSLLPIYHLANDRYTDETETIREIQGSQGLTLNTNFYLDYEFNKKHAMQFNVGFPLLVRESRPDGLTRSSIATLEYKIKF